MLFANFKIKGYKELSDSKLMMTPAKEKSLAACIRKANEHHRKYFEYIKENIDLRKKVNELQLMVSELRKRDTTRTEYDYDITVEEKTVVSRMPFREAMYSVFFGSNGQLSYYAIFTGIIDIVGIGGLIVIASEEKEYLDRLKRFHAAAKRTEGTGAGPIVFWIIAIMLALTFGVPFIRSIFGAVTRKKVEKKVLKNARVVLDTEVRDKLDECYSEIRKSKERIKEIDVELGTMDSDFMARQGY